MTPAARIQSVIEILSEVLATPRPADTLASAYFRARRFIGSKDRHAIAQRLYRIMREYHRLGWWLAQAQVLLTARNIVIAFLMLHREHSLASLNEAFSGGKYAPATLDDAERKLAKMLEGQDLESKDMPLRERLECPEWAFDSLRQTFGEDAFIAEMTAMQGEAPLDLRVNALKAERDEVLSYLKEEGFDAHVGAVSPFCIRVFGRPQIANQQIFQDGYVEIQDQGSQMVAVVADAKPGEQVVDFCAGAGGKTLALAAMMQNKGRIVAMDVLGGRLQRAKERFRRAGAHNIETRPLTSARDKFVKRHAGHFDLVLVDAPCSGTGTWRRDPDKRWRVLGPGIDALVPLQREILDSACRMVKKGGRLVYATCSLLPAENQTQIDEFLAAHPDFKRARDDMHLTPAQHDTDGFYAAVLTRAGDAELQKHDTE